MNVDESIWHYMKEHLGYNDEEMKRFRENPRNAAVLAKGQELLNKTITDFKEKTFNYEKMRLKYWVDLYNSKIPNI